MVHDLLESANDTFLLQFIESSSSKKDIEIFEVEIGFFSMLGAL
jgi:hypothetical protein